MGRLTIENAAEPKNNLTSYCIFCGGFAISPDHVFFHFAGCLLPNIPRMLSRDTSVPIVEFTHREIKRRRG